MSSDYYAWIAGEKSNIGVTSNNELLVSASFGGVVIEAPGINDETDVLAITLNPATTTNFSFSNVTTGYTYLIANDGAVNVTYNVNSDGAMTVKSGEAIQEDNIKFSTFQMINASTTSCALRIRISGV